MQGYCVKCKKKVEIKNPDRTALKGTVRGSCPVCGTGVYIVRKR